MTAVGGEAAPGEVVRQLPPGSLLAPGLLDIQVNGGGGLLFNDVPAAGTVRTIAAAHLRLGTGAILPTLITDRREAMEAAAAAALAVARDDPGLIAGIHFEGPFLSPARPGVHPPAHIRPPAADEVAWLCRFASDFPGRVLMTLAPECVPDPVLAALAEAGIVLSAGHSEASAARLGEAEWVTGVTHVFNGMPPIAGRAPGLAGAALAEARLYPGVIADGIHVDPGLLGVLARCCGGRLVLVSDAMGCVGTDMKEFALFGARVARRDGALRTEAGVLAGADLPLLEAVRRFVSFTGMPAESALRAAALAPARFLGLEGERGRIAPGLRADFVLLAEDLSLLGTFVAGEWQAA